MPDPANIPAGAIHGVNATINTVMNQAITDSPIPNLIEGTIVWEDEEATEIPAEAESHQPQAAPPPSDPAPQIVPDSVDGTISPAFLLADAEEDMIAVQADAPSSDGAGQSATSEADSEHEAGC